MSVIRDLCLATVKGEGAEGYRDALTAIKEKLDAVTTQGPYHLSSATQLDERGLDALLVTDLVNVRWLTGFTGSNGLAWSGRLDQCSFLTDFRHPTQLGRAARLGLAGARSRRRLLQALATSFVGGDGAPAPPLGFDDATLQRQGL